MNLDQSFKEEECTNQRHPPIRNMRCGLAERVDAARSKQILLDSGRLSASPTIDEGWQRSSGRDQVDVCERKREIERIGSSSKGLQSSKAVSDVNHSTRSTSIETGTLGCR